MKDEVIKLRELNEDLNKKLGKIEEKWMMKKTEMEEITKINQEQYDLLFHFITSNFDPNLDSKVRFGFLFVNFYNAEHLSI